MERSRAVMWTRPRAIRVLALLLGGVLAWGAGVAVGPSAEAEEPAFAEVHLRLALPRGGGVWSELDVSMLLLIEPGADAEVEAAIAREGMLARFPGAVDLAGGDVGAQFKLTPYSWVGKTATWSYNPAGKPDGLAGDGEAIEAGALTWNGAGGADWAFARGPESSAAPSLCEGGQPDKENVVAWVSGLPGSTLATTCTYFPGGDVKESDIALDVTREWTTDLANAEVDLQSVALHEFGHMLGLAHTPDHDAVMYSTYSRGTDKRTLTTDDLAGLVSIYGLALGEPTATPSPPASTTPTTAATSSPSGTPTTPTTTTTPLPAGTPTVAPSPRLVVPSLSSN